MSRSYVPIGGATVRFGCGEQPTPATRNPETRRRTSWIVGVFPDLLEAASGRKPVHEKKHVAFQRLSFSRSVTIRRNFWMGIHMMHKIQSTSDTIQSKGDSIKIVILKIIRLLTHDTSLDKTCHLAIWAMRPEFDYSPMAKNLTPSTCASIGRLAVADETAWFFSWLFRSYRIHV